MVFDGQLLLYPDCFVLHPVRGLAAFVNAGIPPTYFHTPYLNVCWRYLIGYV